MDTPGGLSLVPCKQGYRKLCYSVPLRFSNLEATTIPKYQGGNIIRKMTITKDCRNVIQSTLRLIHVGLRCQRDTGIGKELKLQIWGKCIY